MEAYEGAIEMKRTLALILAILMALAAPAVASSQAKKVLSVAKKQIGAPYKLDADSPKSFNCFSFVAYCFNEVSPGTITSSGINGPYDTVTSASKLKAGDIVIFRSNRKLKGIMVANVQKYCLDEVSDHVMALVLTLMRRTAYMSNLLKNGEWAPAKARPMYRLRGSTFGLYGLGGISSLVAKKAQGFGFHVVSYDPFLPDSYFEEMGVTRIETEAELFACADALSIHLPLNEKTAKLVNMEKFKLMKPTAIFINTARGGLVDEADMIKALQDGIIGGAGIDVFADEYPDMANPLFQMDNVIASPHVAYYSEASDVDLRNFAIDQVIGGLRDGAPEFFLNKKDLGR